MFQNKNNSRWDIINDSLTRPILSSEELEKAILSYNLKYRGRWRFHLLHSFFNDVIYSVFLHLNYNVSNLLNTFLFVIQYNNSIKKKKKTMDFDCFTFDTKIAEAVSYSHVMKFVVWWMTIECYPAHDCLASPVLTF